LARADHKPEPFEALLHRRAKTHDRAVNTAQCPDASVIAAYCEHSLTPGETSHWEEHFGSCARCRQMLATMAQIESLDSEPRRASVASWWKLRVLLPGAALAAMVAGIIIFVRAYMPHEPHEMKLAAAERYKGVLPPEAATEPVPNSAPVSTPPLTSKEKQRQAPADLKSMDVAGLAKHLSAPAQFAREQTAAKNAPARGNAQVAPGVTTNKVESPRALASAETASGTASANRAIPQPPAAEAAGGENPPAASPAPQNQIATPGLPGASAILIAPPDHSVVWLVGGRGAISRYAASSAWTPQESGVTADLTAGSAPSASICWVVGRGGTALRTTDGTHWERVSSPTSADLVGVSAESESHATVVAADGHKYATSDGGASWYPI
jgi:hypothetical protein